jgi:flagellar protein FlbD
MVLPVITLTRLSGTVFALNSDLIERVDSTPDTVITLVDGTKYVVTETLREVVDAVRAYRSAVVAGSAHLEVAEPPPEPARTTPRRLVAVPGSSRSTDSSRDGSPADQEDS